jgi:hypothetical protein
MAALPGQDHGKAPKFSSGTLYAMVRRDLEAALTAVPKLTSFGQLVPSSTAGRHQYSLRHPRDDPTHEPLASL